MISHRLVAFAVAKRVFSMCGDIALPKVIMHLKLVSHQRRRGDSLIDFAGCARRIRDQLAIYERHAYLFCVKMAEVHAVNIRA